MSSSYIEARTAEKKEKVEKQDVMLTLYFGVFFDSTESKGKGRELSRLYRRGYQKETERSYSISSTVVEPEVVYVEKDGVVQYNSKDANELNANAGKATENVISNILDIISGFVGVYNLKIKVDIYGFDSGLIAAYALGHIIDPSKDGFAQECKNWIFDEISETHINALKSLSYTKEINHFTIAETAAAINRQREVQRAIEGLDERESGGYKISISAQKTEGLQTEISQHGFTKTDVDVFWDKTQAMLDGLGMIDVFGIGSIADALNVIISVGRGKWGDAALSLIAIIPIIGNYATGAKIARHVKSATQVVKDGSKSADNVIDAADRFRKSNKSKSEKVVDIEDFKEHKVTRLNESEALKNGTNGYTTTNSIGGVSGGGGDYGWSKDMRSRSRKGKNTDANTSLFSSLDDDCAKVEAISEIDNILFLPKVGDVDHGQEHTINIITNWFKWKGNG